MSRYRRCKTCRELVVDPDNCANCANRCDDLSYGPRRHVTDGKRGCPTLDVQEGNWEEWHGGTA